MCYVRHGKGVTPAPTPTATPTPTPTATATPTPSPRPPSGTKAQADAAAKTLIRYRGNRQGAIMAACSMRSAEDVTSKNGPVHTVVFYGPQHFERKTMQADAGFQR
jgi:hypothetical protein